MPTASGSPAGPKVEVHEVVGLIGDLIGDGALDAKRGSYLQRKEDLLRRIAVARESAPVGSGK